MLLKRAIDELKRKGYTNEQVENAAKHLLHPFYYNANQYRESEQIEQDADVIAFLYRDDYYDKETEAKNIIEIIIAKQRNGSVGTIELAFIKEYSKFVNLDHRYSNEAG